jgi:hypothetical protein
MKAGSMTQIPAELHGPRLGAGCERVELGVEPLELAAQDRGELALGRLRGEVGAGVLYLHSIRDTTAWRTIRLRRMTL